MSQERLNGLSVECKYQMHCVHSLFTAKRKLLYHGANLCCP